MLSERRAGIALSLAASIVYGLIALLTTPVIVGGLGVDGFGAYSMALALVAVFMLFDGGLTDAFVRFALARGGHEPEALGRYLASTLPLYLLGVGGLCAVGGAILVGASVAGVLASPGLLLLALLGAAATILGNPFKAALIACERFLALRLMEIAAALATAALTVLAASTGQGPEAVFGGVVVGLVGLALARVLYVRVRLGVAIGLARMPADERRDLQRYAAPILGAAIVEALYWRIDTLIVGLMMGPAAVAVYAVALLFQKHMMRLSAAISRVMVPATLRAVDTGETARELAATLARVARIQAILIGAMMIALVFFGDTFLALWLGPEFAASYGLMLVVLIPFALEQVGSLRNVVLQARRLYGGKARQTLAIALANIGATVLLIPVAGLWGAAGATAAGLLLGLVLANRLLSRHGGVDVAHFYRLILRRAGPALVALALCAGAIDRLPLAGWVGFATLTALYAVGFLAVLWGLAASGPEKAAVRGMLRRVFARVRRRGLPLVRSA